jgi:hypothetical protein
MKMPLVLLPLVVLVLPLLDPPPVPPVPPVDEAPVPDFPPPQDAAATAQTSWTASTIQSACERRDGEAMGTSLGGAPASVSERGGGEEVVTGVTVPVRPMFTTAAPLRRQKRFFWNHW